MDVKGEFSVKVKPKEENVAGAGLHILDQKIRKMLIKIKEEMSTLDVEYLHMRGLTKQGTTDNVKPTSNGNDEAANYDDTNIINYRNFDLTPLETLNHLVEGNIYVEESSESD